MGAKLLKQHRTYKDMISFGLGHGLCEVILLVGLGQVNNLLFCMILQDPQLAASLGFGNDLLQAVNQQLAAASPAMVYLGILERVSAVMYHVFATCLVFMAVKRRRPALYLAAILAHTVFNAGVSLLLPAPLSPSGSEAGLTPRRRLHKRPRTKVKSNTFRAVKNPANPLGRPVYGVFTLA